MAALGILLAWGFVRIRPAPIEIAENTLYRAVLLGAV